MASVFSWQSLLNFVLLHSVLQGQICLLLHVFLDFYFSIPVPYNEKDIFWGCQFQKVLQVFIEPFNFRFCSVTGQGIALDYHNIEWFALEMNRDHSVVFEIASKYCISDSFFYYDVYSISSKGFLHIVVDITTKDQIIIQIMAIINNNKSKEKLDYY